MSAKRKRAVLSIKDKQTIISRLDKGEKGTNLDQEYSISKQPRSDTEGQRQEPKIYRQHRYKRRIKMNH